MTELMVLLLMQVTLFSSVTALILIAVKQIFKCRIPPFLGVTLWIILLVRLLCPVFPESKVSIYNFIPVGRDILYTIKSDIGDEVDARETALAMEQNPYVVEHIGEEALPAPTTWEGDALTVGEYFVEVVGEDAAGRSPEDRAARLNTILLVVYAVGIVVSVGICLTVYELAKRRAYRMSVPCRDPKLLAIYTDTARALGIKPTKIPPLRCGRAAMLVGCIRPQVICRADMELTEAHMVFAHELSHYKYIDNPALLFSTLVVCCFWYNPLIWLVRNMLRDDMEVLCDDRTLTYCHIPRTEYAYMLCRSSAYAELVHHHAGFAMSAGGRRLKTRLRTISTGKQKRFLPRIASVLLCSAIILICLTNPIVSQNSDYSRHIEHYAALTGENERALHLTDSETVSSYLKQVTTLLRTLYDSSLREALGNGSLENFKRICDKDPRIPTGLYRTIMRLRSDEPLTVKNCAMLSAAMAMLLETDAGDASAPLLPKMLLADDFDAICATLTEAEQAALQTCYNRGVAGANVRFDEVYTDAMMGLIAERIDDPWLEAKLFGFYTAYDLDNMRIWQHSAPELRDKMENLKNGHRVYVCDLRITDVERNVLTNILSIARAGEQEDVYYLAGMEDGCTFALAERLIRRSGYTYSAMLDGYAAIGEATAVYQPGISVRFPVVEAAPMIAGSTSAVVRDAVVYAAERGLIVPDEDGVLKLDTRLSCGQGLYYAYRFVGAMLIGE